MRWQGDGVRVGGEGRTETRGEKRMEEERSWRSRQGAACESSGSNQLWGSRVTEQLSDIVFSLSFLHVCLSSYVFVSPPLPLWSPTHSLCRCFSICISSNIWAFSSWPLQWTSPNQLFHLSHLSSVPYSLWSLSLSSFCFVQWLRFFFFLSLLIASAEVVGSN